MHISVTFSEFKSRVNLKNTSVHALVVEVKLGAPFSVVVAITVSDGMGFM